MGDGRNLEGGKGKDIIKQHIQMDIKDMLTAYNLNPDNDAVKSFFERDNIWKILDIQRYEPSHSAFLVWFFNQKITQNSHIRYLLNLLIYKADKAILSDGWNKTSDMKAFANAILTGSYSIKTVSVAPEVVINKLSKIPDRDRLDVFIRCVVSVFDNMGNEQEKTLEIIIENKVDSAEGAAKSKPKDLSACPSDYQTLSQTKRYFYACSKQHENRLKDDVDYQLFVFLTPDCKRCDSPDYVLVSYQDMVDYVFENFLKRHDIDENAKSLIEAYLHNLGNPFNKNNKEIIAMTSEERELLVGFYNRNKQLFETTIEAMIQQATNDGDAEAAKDFSVVKEGLKKARGNHYYTVNGEGKFSPYQIIEKYIKFKLDEGTPFNKILRKDDGSAITHIGPSFISTDPEGVTYNRARGEKPYSFNYLGQDYYISTQLRDKDPKCNVWAFRVYVNKTEPHFQIEVI